MTFRAPMRTCAAVLLAAGLPLAAPALSPEETVAAAERAEKDGALQRAADLYGEFLTDNPDHVQRGTVQYRLAVVQDNMGRVVQAMATLREVIAAPADRSADKHRPDAFMRLARLLADAGKYDEAAATLELLFKEGAGLYEDEAQNLRAGYLAILGKYDEAAILFNLLRNKPTSPFAKEAAYKLAVVWMKAGQNELAKSAIEDFAQRHPTHPRVVELFIRLARMHYDRKDFKSAVDLCRQVMNEFKESPEAMEAAFIVALSYRDAGKLDTAVERLTEVARMPQATHNTVLASESLFEAAQICRKSLNQPDRAVDLYRMAADKARDELTRRQREILEQSLFYEAEHLFQKEKWSAACDLYAQLRKMGTGLNLLGRVLYCQSKMSADGGAAMVAETEEEISFIRRRIADNPNTLIALQSEAFLIDRRLDKVLKQADRRDGPAWSELEPILDEYAGVLTRYPEDVLKQQNMRAYLRMRMGTVYAYVRDDDLKRGTKLQTGILLLDQALAEAPEALFRVEALESLAFLASRALENRKAFEAYRTLFKVTGRDPQAPKRRPPAEYLEGMVSAADTPDLADEAVAMMQQVIASSPADSAETREARFYLAELLYMKQRFSEAAKSYRDFVRDYGPPQEADGRVSASWKKPPQADPALDQVYEAGLRVAHCWRSQGHKDNMTAAYRWVAENQNHLNPRVAEAAYMAVCAAAEPAGLPPDKKDAMARELWTQVVNRSLDFGSKAYQEGFHPWLHESRAVPFVRVALLKAAQLTADAGNHRRAAEMYRQYLELYNPNDTRRRGPDGRPLFANDELFRMASYAVGREYVLAGDPEAMVKAFRDYVDGMRDSPFRPAALQLMGYYGTQAELYADAADAYAALLDEYAPSSATNEVGRFIPVSERLRGESGWNGFRVAPPDQWDAGQVRFGLGYLYWKKEQWEPCQTVLRPFADDSNLRTNASRGEALFMMGRSQMNLRLYTAGQETLARLIREHPDFKGVEDAYMELVRSYVGLSNWEPAERYYLAYVEKHPAGLRRTYMDVYGALARIGRGQAEEGEQTLRDLARSETYEDVKAEAYYRLAERKLAASPPDAPAALALLRKSVESYPLAPAVLAAGRCAAQTGDRAAAREFLDRLVREFPKADRELIEEAQRLRRDLMEPESKKR